MGNLSNVGRIFYGLAIIEEGVHTIYYRDFPYMLLPPNHSWIPGFAILAFISGVMFVLTGACLVFGKKTRPISLLLGGVLLLIFCFCFIPYQFMTGSNYMHLGEWENAEKELALAGGAFVIAGCFSEKNENSFFSFLAKLIPLGAILFSITMISFGILHFLFAKDASTLIPSWIPNHMFWIYFAGVALIGSGIAIILKIKTGLIAALLGTMIFIWFIVLHIPRVIASSATDMGDEITSAFLALAYSGIAFVIAGATKKKEENLGSNSNQARISISN
jgi:uncharacterized membrane protein YphA (DoxX/SURF4 family)